MYFFQFFLITSQFVPYSNLTYEVCLLPLICIMTEAHVAIAKRTYGAFFSSSLLLLYLPNVAHISFYFCFALVFPPSCCLQRNVDAPPLSVLAARVQAEGKGSIPRDFALCLALNHTVQLEEDPTTGKKKLQAESPDEEALVDGAKVRPKCVLFFGGVGEVLFTIYYSSPPCFFVHFTPESQLKVNYNPAWSKSVCH